MAIMSETAMLQNFTSLEKRATESSLCVKITCRSYGTIQLYWSRKSFASL